MAIIFAFPLNRSSTLSRSRGLICISHIYSRCSSNIINPQDLIAQRLVAISIRIFLCASIYPSLITLLIKARTWKVFNKKKGMIINVKFNFTEWIKIIKNCKKTIGEKCKKMMTTFLRMQEGNRKSEKLSFSHFLKMSVSRLN